MLTTVSSAEALVSALKTAHAGDTIQLASGAYAGITAANLHFSSSVTVTAAPGADAVITGLAVTNSSGLTFSNLELYANPTGALNPFVVATSSNIRFDALNVHGSMDGNPQNDVGAMLIRGSTNVSVTNSQFQQLQFGVSQLDNLHLTISGNDFHDLRTDAIRGGGASYVTVSNNTFHDFHPVAGDHGDAIQFWTTNTTTPAHDITVTDNLFYRGAGGVAQGVFLGNEAGLTYQNVTIAGNDIIGAMYNGIALSTAHNVSIHDNSVIGFTDMKSWIRLDAVDGATLTNNAANALLTNASDTNLHVTGEVTVAQASDGGAAALSAWGASHGSSSTGGSTGAGGTGSGSSGTGADTGGTGVSGHGLSLTATASHQTLTGGAMADTLTSGDGTDVLNGGGGNDVYVLNGARPTIVEQANGGTDTARSSISYTLPNNVENLVLTTSRASSGGGNSLNNQMTGNDAANGLMGQMGNDTLSGGGGADTLTGGPGADHFVFAKGDGHDVITDFGTGDLLDVSSLLGANSKPTMTDGSAGVTLSFSSGDSILLDGVHASALHATSQGYIL